jgi:hypothetical protein
VCEKVALSTVRLLKSVTGLGSKSAHKMSHRPPFNFCRSWSRSRNVLLWRLIRSLAVNRQLPSMCMFVSGDWHLRHMRDVLYFLLHLWMCTPHATSKESLLARKGAIDYACIVWSDPVALASCKIWLYMVPWLVVVFDVCVRMSLRRLACKSASLVMLGVVPFPCFRVWGQVLSPPMGGSASVNIMSGVLCPSTTLRAAVSAS